MDKELLQAVIDNLMPSNPRQKEFEEDLRKLLKAHENPKTIRLTCEEHFEKPKDEEI
jgi:hypothetical protein